MSILSIELKQCSRSQFLRSTVYSIAATTIKMKDTCLWVLPVVKKRIMNVLVFRGKEFCHFEIITFSLWAHRNNAKKIPVVVSEPFSSTFQQLPDKGWKTLVKTPSDVVLWGQNLRLLYKIWLGIGHNRDDISDFQTPSCQEQTSWFLGMAMLS